MNIPSGPRSTDGELIAETLDKKLAEVYHLAKRWAAIALEEDVFYHFQLERVLKAVPALGELQHWIHAYRHNRRAWLETREDGTQVHTGLVRCEFAHSDLTGPRDQRGKPICKFRAE